MNVPRHDCHSDHSVANWQYLKTATTFRNVWLHEYSLIFLSIFLSFSFSFTYFSLFSRCLSNVWLTCFIFHEKWERKRGRGVNYANFDSPFIFWSFSSFLQSFYPSSFPLFLSPSSIYLSLIQSFLNLSLSHSIPLPLYWFLSGNPYSVASYVRKSTGTHTPYTLTVPNFTCILLTDFFHLINIQSQKKTSILCRVHL